MKRVVLIAALLLAGPAASPADDQMRDMGLKGRTLYRLQVEGKVCPFCAYSVEQRLQGALAVGVAYDLAICRDYAYAKSTPRLVD